MTAEQLDRVYGELSEALGRVGEERATLLLATLALDLLTCDVDPQRASAAVMRAERLSQV